VGEVKYLWQEKGVQRVQFIDDNVLPTLPEKWGVRSAVAEQSEDLALDWTREFLGGLALLRADGKGSPGGFGWRGLMRIEDYISYSERITDFSKQLAHAGCYLLAFGLEVGDEKLRSRLKGNNTKVKPGPTNEVVASALVALREQGILLKGYFMIGGHAAASQQADKTIELACALPLDLAYFAIFKQFRGFVNNSNKNFGSAPRFGLVDLSFRDLASSGSSAAAWKHEFGVDLSLEQRQMYAARLSKLYKEGFSFGRMFKYNDIHIDPGISDRLYKSGGFDGQDAFVQKVKLAYLKFYAREEWLNRYQLLLAAGY
jgi:hypothetical protein